VKKYLACDLIVWYGFAVVEVANRQPE